MTAFVKLDRRYPLTKFRAYLLEHAVQYPDEYVSAIRHLLAAVEAPTPGPDGALRNAPQWQNFRLVVLHCEQLPRRRQSGLRAAWNHWLGFCGVNLPRLGPGPDTGRGPLAEALRRLVAGRKNMADVLKFEWWRANAQAPWRARAPDGTLVWTEAKWQPLLRVVREWSYPGARPGTDDCANGDCFLPELPTADVRMDDAVFYRLLKRHDPEAGAELERAMKRAVLETSRALSATRAPEVAQTTQE